MKIVSWNCAGKFREKYEALSDLNADILIIQECENPEFYELPYKDWAKNYLWIGDKKYKGIGIFCGENIVLEKLDWQDHGFQLFLPCLINNSLPIIAVWNKQANSPTFGYIGQFWKYMQVHKEKFSEKEIIICGDFNSNSKWDKWDRWWNHSDVVRELNEINIKCVYHTIFHEEQGQETKPTFFLHYNRQKPYHIDYFFASERLIEKKSYEMNIGDPDHWLSLSDHMPISFLI